MQAQIGQHQGGADGQWQIGRTARATRAVPLRALLLLGGIGAEAVTHLLNQLLELVGIPAHESLEDRRMIAQILFGEHGTLSFGDNARSLYTSPLAWQIMRRLHHVHCLIVHRL